MSDSCLLTIAPELARQWGYRLLFHAPDIDSLLKDVRERELKNYIIVDSFAGDYALAASSFTRFQAWVKKEEGL